MSTLTEFLLARLAEDGAWAQRTECECGDHASWPQRPGCPDRVLAEVEAKRRIVEWHRKWPVLVETPPAMEQIGSDITSMTYRMTQQIAWATEQQYRERFGTEPPTGPVLRLLAAVYSDHPDYDESWRP